MEPVDQLKGIQRHHLKDLIKGFIAASYILYDKYKIEIISSKSLWRATFGMFQLKSDIPLIYESMNNRMGFDNFKRFSGWKKPAGKHNEVKKMCDVDAQVVYNS